MNRIHGRLATLTLGFAVLAACNDRSTPTEPTGMEVPSEANAAALGASPEIRPQEAEFHRLSREIPGYGGHFFDEQGVLVVLLRDVDQAAAARTVLKPLLETQPLSAREPRRTGQGSIIVRQADFTFPQLATWRDRATDEALGKEGVEFVDLDEAGNRVVVGVSSTKGRMAAAEVLSRRGVPEKAIQYEQAQPAVPDQSLTGFFRPLRGGFQIASPAGFCTLGFNAVRNGQSVVLTNSHCTGSYWGFDGSIFHQPVASNPIGPEIVDPAPTPCGFLNLWRCRWSDAAIVRRNAGVTSDFGYIARTQSFATGLNNAGSLTVNPNNPRMRITGELAFPALNQELDKVGRTTGWTYGRVAHTCVDISAPADLVSLGTVKCQYLTRNMWTAGGDSGSPMFRWDGNTVTLAGLHWGRVGYGGENVAIMSPMVNIRADLGAFTTH